MILALAKVGPGRRPLSTGDNPTSAKRIEWQSSRVHLAVAPEPPQGGKTHTTIGQWHSVAVKTETEDFKFPPQ